MDREIKNYSKFVRTTKNGEKVSFVIQTLTKDRIEETVDIMMHKNLNEEEFVQASGISNSKDAMTEMQKQYYAMIEDDQNPILVCYVENERKEIAGLNLLYRDTSKDTIDNIMKKCTSPEMKIFFRIVKATYEFCSPLDKLNVDLYLSGAGLYVNKDYRGCGVATELLKARKPLCEELNIPVTGAWFTGLGSQIAAKKAGYEVIGEMPYAELAEKTDVTFANAPEFCKLMVLKIE